MRKPIRVLLITLGALLLLVAARGAAALLTIQASFPRTRGTLTVKGLNEPVEVLRDRLGVPHIRARNMHDLYFAQGFVTAQERFWQMEFWRRIGSGRLSELFGKATLGTDIYLRTVGFRRVADLDYAAMSQEARDVYQAYADGVNAYILNRPARKLSLEFALLELQGVKFQIEPWVPQNSLTWLKLMSQDLGANMRREMYTIDLIQTLGLPLTREFFGTYRAGEMPFIVPDSELRQSLLRKGAGGVSRDAGGLSGAQARLRAPRALHGVPVPDRRSACRAQRGEHASCRRFRSRLFPGYGTGAGIGSNNWVIAGPALFRASRSWPMTLTSESRCLRSGRRWTCTAPPRTHRWASGPGKPSTCGASPSRVSRASSWGTMTGLPGASRMSIPTCRTSTSNG